MPDVLKVENIEKINNKITVYFSADGEWSKYIKNNKIENTYDENIESVPDSIAIIPLLCNILPIAWVFDLKISLTEIDEVFYDAIPKILSGYKKMYPKFDFGGSIEADKIIKNKYMAKRVGVLFSGGVDATTTAYRHMDEKPDIITILGSDIKLDDKEGIENVNRFNKNFSDNHKLKYERIYSTFRTFIDEGKLQEDRRLKTNKYGWWHEFQHGIGLIGLVAPLSYVRGYNTVYIASSYSEKMSGMYTCASDPMIDNQLKYGSTITIHDGYELTRQDKVKFICGYIERYDTRPYIRVCWQSSGGNNCCHCEKCRRTYLAFLIEKTDPSNIGLNFNDAQKKSMIKTLKKRLKYKYYTEQIELYKDMQDRFIKNYTAAETPKELCWFRTIKIGEKKSPFYLKYIDAIKARMGR